MLADADEGLHAPPPGAHERWQENQFFIAWDDVAATGLLCHVQRVPGLGLQEARIVVVLDGVAASVTVEAAYDADQLVPGLSAEATTPYREWRVRTDVDGVVGTGPLGLLATATTGDTPIAADLTLRSDLPVVDFAEGLADIVAGLRDRPDGPQMGDQQHYEQGGTVQGTIAIGDRTAEVSGLFVRDHSWGVRSEHSGFQAFWTASCLDGGRLFSNAIGIPSGDRVMGIGAIADGDGVAFTTDVAADFRPAPGIASYDDTVVDFGDPLLRRLTGRTEVHLPILLPHSGPGRYDNNAISRVAMDGKVGFGVLEFASVLDSVEALG